MSESNPAETRPAEASGQQGDVTPEFDPYAEDLDALRTKIESAQAAEEEAAEELTEEAVEEQPVEEEIEAAPEEQPEVEEESATEEQAESEEEKQFSELDEAKAMLDLQQAETRRLESLLGREAGAKGFQQSRVQALEQQIADLRRQMSTGEEIAEEASPVPSTAQQSRSADPNTSYLVGLAIKDAGNTFFQQTPEVFLKGDNGAQKLDPAFEAALGEEASKVGDILTAADPATAAAGVSRLLTAAWTRVDRDRKKAHLELIQRRRAEQGKRLKDKKRAAASASTGAPSKRPQKREVDPFKIPLDKLRKLAEQETKDL